MHGYHQPNLAEIARKHLTKAKNDVAEATSTMAEEIQDDDKLFRTLMTPHLRNACYDVIRGLVRGDRGKVWVMPQPTAAEEKEAIKHAARGIMDSYWGFPLPDGTYLGLATKAQVIAARDFYAKQANDMGAKARWMDYIAKSLQNDDDVVKDVLKPRKLGALKAKAEG